MPKTIDDLVNEITNLKGTIDTDLKTHNTNVAKIGQDVEGMGTKLADAQKQVADLQKAMDEFRRAQLAEKQNRPRVVRAGYVSEECAKHLAAMAIVGAERQGKLAQLTGANHDAVLGKAKDILAETKTALTSTDIPLPTTYAGEISELMDVYGTARRYGTVYPMGDGTVKLPRGKTYTAFGLLTIATAITEKSPQIEFVTLAASKWGGMVRVPSEINQDSFVPLGQFIARYAAREMAKLEDTVFWTADGTGTYDSLKGLTLMVNAANNNKLLTMGMGKTTVADVTLTNLRDLRGKCDNAALYQAAYYLHQSLESKLCSFNTESKVQVYVPNGANGATLDGWPIRWINVLPTLANVTASTIFGLFGDASYEYLAIRSGMALQSSDLAGFETDEILIRALERFTIANLATGAVAGISTAAA